jgi:hypothetical protein
MSDGEVGVDEIRSSNLLPRLAVDDSGDQRRENRFRTICRIAKVTRSGDIGLWRIHNISDNGMMLGASIQVRTGETMQVGLSETVVLSGKVIWSENGRSGVLLDEPIDSAAILRHLAAEQRSGRYRAQRLPLKAWASAMTRDGAFEIELADVSQSGAGFLYEGLLVKEAGIDLCLGKGLKRKSIIRWFKNGRGGLWFKRPLERADLESIRHFEV